MHNKSAADNFKNINVIHGNNICKISLYCLIELKTLLQKAKLNIMSNFSYARMLSKVGLLQFEQGLMGFPFSFRVKVHLYLIECSPKYIVTLDDILSKAPIKLKISV